ncbi:hypothetical protein TSAR_008613 [Trichomalopsis sarcophagae]|uniref:Uncharacterized protein n=1 Tax=Trichomalopsis sarcophagae TaxID=543379 RepID=A0A232EIE7_9HYME|nr:hypothetical protein TSAR_008613 [Trichomalopsis sarcophagae]
MHLKEHKIIYFSPFGSRDRPLCSADKMKKLPCTQFQLIYPQYFVLFFNCSFNKIIEIENI